MKFTSYKMENSSLAHSISHIPNSSRSGYTLIELMVAFTMFAIIISIVISIFVTSYQTERSISELVLVNDNTYLSLEQMARDIRDGREFEFAEDPDLNLCSPNCFSFKNRTGELVFYGISNNTIIRRVQRIGEDWSPPKNLTADNISITRFTVTHNDCDLDVPTRVTINLEVRQRNNPRSDYVNNIQTTVSTRNYSSCSD